MYNVKYNKKLTFLLVNLLQLMINFFTILDLKNTKFLQTVKISSENKQFLSSLTGSKLFQSYPANI